LIEPIDEEQRAQVRLRTQYYIELAQVIFDRKFDHIPVRFDLSGTTAGMFRRQGRRCEIRYNPWIFAKYLVENMRDTVPHEVAHYVVYCIYGERRIKPHGPQWQDVMARYGADAGVTFNLDLEGIPQRRQRTHPYHCGCQTHDVSTTRHNRIRKGASRYHCRTCAGELCYLETNNEEVEADVILSAAGS